MKDELKPCPFCGSGAQYGYEEAFSIDSSYGYIGCTDDYGCGARIPYTKDRNSAVLAWNRRSDQTA